MSSREYRLLTIVLLSALILPTFLGCSPAPAQSADRPTAAPEAAATQPNPPSQSSEPTQAPAVQSVGGGDPSERVANALGLLLGSGGDGPALPSAHLEATTQWPAWDADAGNVVNHSTTIQADMQGEKNVHLFYTDTDSGQGEGYLYSTDEGDRECAIVDGKAQASFDIGLTWAMWPLQPVIMLSVGSLGATAQGSEAIDGRPAEVYAVDLAKADPATLAGLQAFIGKGVKKITGTVSVDQETGALLKADLDSEEDLYDQGGDTAVGSGTGHFEILVTQVGKATVEVPAVE